LPIFGLTGNMENKKLFIKNMVCNRCRTVVQAELVKLGLAIKEVQLGEVDLLEEPTADQLGKLRGILLQHGFELIDDHKSKLINQVKKVIIEQVHYPKSGKLKVNFSDYLVSILHKDYPYLSNLFSEVEGTTIEKFMIHQKIERVKELLVYDEFSLSEIADQLGYSSVAHLSSQFKKITGLTPSYFKRLGQVKRKALDQV
jgi:AraC-like DNA-binding protein